MSFDHALSTLFPAAPPQVQGVHMTPAEAVTAWLAAVADPLQRGCSHLLSNRVGALDAIVEELHDSRDEPSRSAAMGHLRTELGRLFELNALLRLLPPDCAPEEAFDLRELAEDTVRVASHHLDFRHSRHAATVDGSAEPVRTVRWAMFRSIVALVDGTRRQYDGDVRIILGGTSELVTVEVRADAAGAPPRLDVAGVPYAAYLLASLGIALHADTEACYRIEMPSLSARRARDRARKD